MLHHCFFAFFFLKEQDVVAAVTHITPKSSVVIIQISQCCLYEKKRNPMFIIAGEHSYLYFKFPLYTVAGIDFTLASVLGLRCLCSCREKRNMI